MVEIAASIPTQTIILVAALPDLTVAVVDVVFMIILLSDEQRSCNWRNAYKNPGSQQSGASSYTAILLVSSPIQTITVGTGITPVQPLYAGRGLTFCLLFLTA